MRLRIFATIVLCTSCAAAACSGSTASSVTGARRGPTTSVADPAQCSLTLVGQEPSTNSADEETFDVSGTTNLADQTLRETFSVSQGPSPPSTIDPGLTVRTDKAGDLETTFDLAGGDSGNMYLSVGDTVICSLNVDAPLPVP